MLRDADEFISISEACKLIPGRPHMATVFRWTLNGVGGVRLESAKVGGRRFVTRAALEDFIARLSAPQSNHVSGIDAESQARAEAAGRELDRLLSTPARRRSKSH